MEVVNKVKQFPRKQDRPEHVYMFDTCIGCHKEIGDTERFAEIVMESVDGMKKNHVALCERCDSIAERNGVFG